MFARYPEMIQIYVFLTNCEFLTCLLWTQLFKFCLDFFEPYSPPPCCILPFCVQISDNLMALVYVLEVIFPL